MDLVSSQSNKTLSVAGFNFILQTIKLCQIWGKERREEVNKEKENKLREATDDRERRKEWSVQKKKVTEGRKEKGGKGAGRKQRQTGEKREKKIKMRVGQEACRNVRKAEKKATQFEWFQPGLCILKQYFLNPCFNHKLWNAVWTGNSLQPDVSPNVFLLKNCLMHGILLRPSPCLKANLEASIFYFHKEQRVLALS